MDVIEAMKKYIDEMVKETGVGIKALLMDKDTVCIAIFLYVGLSVFFTDLYRLSCFCTVGNVGKRGLPLRAS